MTAATVLQMVVRLAGLILIILGILFWTGHADALVPVHTLLGIVLVVALWGLSALASQAGVQPGMVGLAVLWGMVALVLGLTQERLLTGNAHGVIQVLHLIIGLGAIGLAESLGVRIRRGRSPAARPA